MQRKKSKKNSPSTQRVCRRLSVYLGIIGLIALVGWRGFCRLFFDREWITDNRVGLVLDMEDEYQLVTVQKGERVVVFEFDKQIEMGLVEGYGNYELNTVNELMNQEKDYQKNILIDSIENVVGIPVLGVYQTSADLGWGGLLRSRDWYSIGFLDRLKFMILFKKGESEKRSINLVDQELVEPKLIGNEKKVFEIKAAEFNQAIRGLQIYDSVVVQSDMTIGVVNGTLINGLGRSVREVLINYGYVVPVVTSEPRVSLSTILVDSQHVDDYWGVVWPMSKIFGIEDIKFQEGLVDDYRADVVIMIGKDMAGFLGED